MHVRWEYHYQSYICLVNMKLKPAAGYLSLALRLETEDTDILPPYYPVGKAH